MTCNNVFTILAAVALLICATSAATPNHGMKFHASSFLINEGSNAAPHGIAVPVAIQLVDSEGKADTSDSTIVITASVANGASISGNVATVSNGVARFMMTFTSCTGSAVTFTAHSANGAAVSGKTLVSGVISVAAVPNSEVMFDAASALQAGQPATVSAGSSLPAFKINLYDSCGNVDTTMTGLTIVATASNGVSLGASAVATFTDGVAIFSGLTVESTTEFTFTVGASATPVAASNKKLSTGPVSVAPKGLSGVSHSALAIVFAGVCVAMLAAVVIVSNARSASKKDAAYVIVATSSVDADVV